MRWLRLLKPGGFPFIMKSRPVLSILYKAVLYFNIALPALRRS